jgi:hypothetical protein
LKYFLLAGEQVAALHLVHQVRLLVAVVEVEEP